MKSNRIRRHLPPFPKPMAIIIPSCLVRPVPYDLNRSSVWKTRVYDALADRALVPHPRVPTSVLFEIVDATFPTNPRVASARALDEMHAAAARRRYRSLAAQLGCSWPLLRPRLSAVAVQGALWCGQSTREFPYSQRLPRYQPPTPVRHPSQARDHRTIPATTERRPHPARTKKSLPETARRSASRDNGTIAKRRPSPRES